MRRTFSDALSSAVRLRLPARDALAAAVKVATGDDWSPEARAAAAEARKKSAAARAATTVASTPRDHK